MVSFDTTPRVHFVDTTSTASQDTDDSDAKPNFPSPPPPLVSSLTPKVFHTKELRENLMREHVDRDPLFYYEVVSVLGVGSMGSVAKVRKRDSVVGGSARASLQKHFRKEKRRQQCFDIPCLGSMFQACFGAWGTHDSVRSSSVDDSDGNSSILRKRTSIVEDYNDGHGETSGYGQIYAMKSIHLSRVTDPTFVQELMNEIQILRTLDHPHIVRPIETFDHRNQVFIVMELCTGGDLYSRDPYTEDEAARIISSVLSAVSYMHFKNICHRYVRVRVISTCFRGTPAQLAST